MAKYMGFSILYTSLLIMVNATAGEQAANETDNSEVSTAKVLPEGPGRDAVMNSCAGVCHDTSVLFQGYSADDWVNSVNEMIGLGAQVSDEDYVPLLTYLITNFSSDADK